ncbi:MAG: leucine-rich repeat protein [Mangrovibacterium sp.]
MMKKSILLMFFCLTAAVGVWAQQSGADALIQKLDKWRKAPVEHSDAPSLEKVRELEQRLKERVPDIHRGLKYQFKPMEVRYDNTQAAIKTRAASFSKTINITAGGLSSALTSEELSTITALTVTGTMDARDFKTIRDKMTVLADLDLSGVKVAAYTGTEGTDTVGVAKSYEANAIPQFAFWNSETHIVRTLNSVKLPASITLIGDFAFLGQQFTSFTIPSSVKKIGYAAFQHCSNMTSLIIPNSMEAIGILAFSDCAGLRSITIGSGVEIIERSAFAKCTSLTSVTIPNSVETIEGNAFTDCTGLITVNFNAVNCTTMIRREGNNIYPVFYGCSAFTTLNIGNNVTTIPDEAFSYCSSLESVTVPNSVTTIGKGAFYKCASMATVNFNAVNCATMGSELYPVFLDCSALTTLNISNEVTAIPSYAFRGCDRLTSVFIGNRLKTIGDGAFGQCAGLSSLIIPDNVETIGAMAFALTGLTSVTIGKGIKTIGDQAFGACFSLATVNFNAVNCTVMGSESYPVFLACSALTTLNIGGEVKTIQDFTFYECGSLISVSIPNNVEIIGVYAFGYCEDLTSLIIGNGVKTIREKAFEGCFGLTSVTIPNSVKTIGEGAFALCAGLTSIMVEGGNLNYCSVDGILFDKMQTVLVQFPPAAGTMTYTIPNSVKTIGRGAFAACAHLASVTIPDNVETIGIVAFAYCSGLTSIIIPNSVETIGTGAFAYCSGLQTFKVYHVAPADISGVEYIFKETPVAACSLYVPAGSEEAYRKAAVWKEFGTIQGFITDEVSYNWLQAPAILVVGNTSKVVGPRAGEFTKFYINGTETPLVNGEADLSGKTGELDLKVSTANGGEIVRLKISK